MNALIAVAAALLTVQQVYAGPMALVAKCMSDNGVTGEDALKFAMSGEASDNVKCNFKCIMLGAGTMTEDGKLLLAPMLEHAPAMLHDVFKKCVEIETSADLCDLAFRHNKCVRDAATEWYQGMVKGASGS